MKNLTTLSLRYLKQNRHRTITTIIGVLLSSMLVYIIFVAGNSIYDSVTLTNYEKSYGVDAIYSVTYEQCNDLLSMAPYYEKESAIEINELEVSHAFAFCSSYQTYINDFKAMPVPFDMVYGTVPKSFNSIIIYNEDARLSDLKVGDKIQTFTSINNDSFEKRPDTVEKQISGTFDETKELMIENPDTGETIGLYMYSSYMLMSDEVMQEAASLNKLYVCVTFANKDNLTDKIALLSSHLNNCKYYINPDALEAFENENSLTYLAFNAISLLIAAVVAFLTMFIVRNAFNISVHERNNDYAILRCIGMDRRQIIKIVLAEAFIISLIGVVFGMLIGQGIVTVGFWYIRNILDLSSVYKARFYLKAVGFTLLYTVVTTAYAMIAPVEQLYKLNPIEAIRRVNDVKQKKLKSGKGKLLTKLFGVEVGYAYKNVMRKKGRFLITVFSLVVCSTLFVGITTAFSMINKWIKTCVYTVSEYEAAFYIDDENISKFRKNLYDNELIEKDFVFKSGFGFVTEDSDFYKSTNALCGLYLGFDNKNYNKIADMAGSKIKFDANVIPVIKLTDDTEHELGSTYTFYNGDTEVTLGITAEISWQDLFNYIKEIGILNYVADYSNMSYIIYNMDDGFMGPALCPDGKDGFNNVGNDYKMLVKLNPDTDSRKFDEFLKKCPYWFDDTYTYLKEIYKSFQAVEAIIILFILILLIIIIVNNINMNRSDMIMRRKEFEILQTIGMSYRQHSKMLYAESLFSTITASIIGSILGTFLGFLISYGIIIDDLLDGKISFSANPISIIISFIIFIVFGIISVFLSREEDYRLG